MTQLLVPALILGIATGAALMRLTRGMLLEVLRQDYVRTAWAKGLAERVIVMKHGLRNGVNLVVVSLIVLVNLGVDTLYAVLDPRIRY